MKTIVFDIETIPQNTELLLARAPDFRPDSRLKDPAKIEESIAKKRNDFLEYAALDWKTAQVVLIGLGDDHEITSLAPDCEKQLISNFFSLVASALEDGCTITGHNIKGFDFPMLVNRARVLGVSVPQMILGFYRGKPQWHELIIDTLEVLTFGNKQDISGNGVDDIARTFGFPAKMGHGGEFPTLWKSDRDAAIAYNRRDVEIEIEIARVCGLI